MRALALAHATVLAATAAMSACIYAPFDLGLDAIGQVYEAPVIDGRTDEKVLLLRVDGEISDHATDGGILGSAPSMTSRVRLELDMARQDESVRGVLLRIDSPGGGVTASDLIYREITRFRQETGKPVVAYLLDTAASGGYYIAVAADRIIASPTTITGSIGVIAYFPNVKGLADKVGVEVKALTSGPNKDIGSPFRPMAPEEEKLLRGMILSMYERFVDVVVEGRRAAGLTPAEARLAADGRVFTAKEALEKKLVDDIGYFEDALRAVAKAADLERPRVVTYERRAIGGSRPTVYSRTYAGGSFVRVKGEGGAALEVMDRVVPPLSGPALQYLWVPGSR